MNVSPDYTGFRNAARRLLEPLAALMLPGRADLAIAGPASDHDAQADRLESFARPLLLAAFWLHAVDRDGVGDALAFRDRIAAWFRDGLVAGTNPSGPHYWGPDASYHQHHVEMGLMVIALQFARGALWDPLADGERAQVAAWFGTSRGGGIVNNNHLFMSVHILEFLRVAEFEHRTDRAAINAHLNQLETMYRGDGWFEDGINQAYDHYNAYAFHFYGLCWARLHGDRDLERATRWREWARLFVDDYQYFFAASGEHPAFGRSITYRFNAINVFGLAVAEECTDLAPGMLRRLCARNLDFFLSRPIYQEQGCLAPGFTDRFDRIIEPYSCAASPYWAAKGFTPLLLPPTHAFWTDPEKPLPAERGFVRAMPVPGLITRSIDGEVEILNAGSMVSNSQTRYGPWKWSKIAYRTGTHFTFAFPESANYSYDGALTQTLDDGRIFGRHSTVAVEMDDDHVGYSYGLGFKVGQVNTGVETFVWWKAGWLLHVHTFNARQSIILRLGGFALPLKDRQAERPDSDNVMTAWSTDGRGTVLQPLAGSTAAEWDTRLDDTTERRHVAAPYHATPVLRTERLQGPGFLAALSWSGSDRSQAQPWTIFRGGEKAWVLSHPTLGQWIINHWALPDLSARKAPPLLSRNQ
ncbi:MAG TPA: DUF2264 domain-containing protein [Opitutaceae bacterium]